MPTLSYVRKAALRQPGFYFPRSHVFPDIDEGVRRRIYLALIGEVPYDGTDDNYDIDMDVVKERAGRCMQNLYQAILDNAEMFRALRGDNSVWNLIANQAVLYSTLTGEDAKTAVDEITNGRLAYEGKANPDTILTALADQYIALVKETEGPPRVFTLAMHGGQPGSSSSVIAAPSDANKIIEALGNKLKQLNLHTAAPWPPAYFPARDMLVLADRYALSVLSGVDPANPQPRQPVHDVDSFCLPNKDFALFMKQVGFLTHDLHQKWYMAAGREVRASTTLHDYLTYAKDALSTRGKTFVVGFFTYWVSQSYGVNPTVDITREDPDVWGSGHMIRRYASVVVLRLVRGSSATGESKLQIISYEPFDRSKVVKQQFAHSANHIYAYRDARMTAIREWAAGNGVGLHSRYFGGHVPSGVASEDSVRASMEFVKAFVSAGGLDDVIPHADDEQGFKRLRFTKVEG